MDPRKIELAFPGLVETGYEVTSPSDPRYNCFAWAAGDQSRWWQPPSLLDGGYYWPSKETRQNRAAVVKAYETLGFRRCDDGATEPGWARIALFEREEVITHAARQLPDGRWTSKLGTQQDIAHQLQALDGTQEYGNVVVFLKRRL